MAGPGARRREECVKLFATALSNLGVASLVTGVIAPMLAGRILQLTTLVALLAALVLHACAQVMLHFVVRSDREDA